MSETRGPRTWEAEKAAIDEAYHDRIKCIFDIYCIGKDEHDALTKFKSAMESARRAHIRALSVLSDHDSF
jgi:hypothetical protein